MLQPQLSFILHTAYMLLLTGGFLLIFDVKLFAKADFKREKKAARLFGIVNVVTGLSAMAGYWVYLQYR